MSALPKDSAGRKAIPMCTGVLDYFPDALAEVAKVSKAGNDKHNPGQPLHHERSKSSDHADSLLRHLADRGGIDPDTGMRHSAQVAWRALALLQEELETAGAPRARGACSISTAPNFNVVQSTITPPQRCGVCGEELLGVYMNTNLLGPVHFSCYTAQTCGPIK
ncbi:MAG TPA: dATP/dGTP diphosphohydrolase domain-containing protein [Methylomirabilota bacterium]|nr:dATP/dGTP diphosphohydrolase domain-containing protein [Methylomirabilota bacterium]